jgi:hypothetical protein
MPHIPADYRPLEASERTLRAGAKRTGPANPDEILTVSVRVRRRSDAPALPDPAFATATPRRGKPHLSREEFAARYGASEDDLAAIAAFAAANGLSVVESSIARRTIVLKGTVAQMNAAFAVDLGTYESVDEKYRGREGPLYLPTAIADIVEGVFGLDNRKMAEPHLASATKRRTQLVRTARCSRRRRKSLNSITSRRGQPPGRPSGLSSLWQAIGTRT